jgi:hypothetical protein
MLFPMFVHFFKIHFLFAKRNIFKRRGVRDAPPTAHHRLKKRVVFLFDCSGSMYRFNGADHRLEKSCQTAIMVMEG